MSSQTSFSEAQLQASADHALTTLEALTPQQAEALVAAWVKSKNAAAVQEVAERGTGLPRKAARRGLNVLKSQKVEIPAPVRKSPLLPGSEPQAWLLPPDASGIRVVGIITPEAGQWRGCVVFLRDGQAVFKLDSSTTTPAKLKGALKKALPGSGLEPVAVPVDWARYKIAQCRSAMSKNKLTEPLGFMSARRVLEPVPSSAPEHPFDREGYVLAPEDAKAQAEDSGVLHHQPEFRSWLPSQNAVQQLLAEVGKHLTPGEEPEQAHVSELLKSEMLRSTDRVFTPELREDLVGWMKDAGISLLAREGEGMALKLAATIQCIESAGLVTNTPAEVPFLRAFFEKAIGLLMAQNQGRLNIPIPKAARPAPDTAGAQ